MGASPSKARHAERPQTPTPDAAAGTSLRPYDQALEAQVQSRIHYQSYPVFNVLTDDRHLIEYARSRKGAVWLSQANHYGAAPLIVQSYTRDQPAVPRQELSYALHDHLSWAKQAGDANGDAARLLRFGPSFRESTQEPVAWRKIWKSKKTVMVPPTRDDPDWLPIRRTLAAERSILLKDDTRGKILAFRLDRVGNVEMQVENIARMLAKRGTRSDIKDRQLSKRMEAGPSSTYNGRPDRIVTFRDLSTRFVYDPPATQLTDEQRERMFADTVHYNGVPVISGGQVYKSQVQHALHAHDPVWLTSIPPNDPHSFEPPVKMYRDGQLRPFRAQEVSAYLSDAAAAQLAYGKKVMNLMYGMPFSRRQPSGFFSRSRYSKPSWSKVDQEGTSFPIADSDVYHMRRHLDSNNFLKAVDSDNNKVWGLRLDAAGKVEIENLLNTARRIAKRMTSESETFEPRTSKYVEFYLQRLPRDDRLAPLSAVEKGRFYSEHLHYKGEPIFVPATDSNVFHKVRQAMHDYPGYWIVGGRRDDPDHIIAKRVQSADYRLSDHGSEEVIERMQSLKRLGDAQARDMMLLTQGPPFPERRRPSLFRSYKTPSWTTVGNEAPKLSVHAPTSEKWQTLHDSNMLVVVGEHSTVGYVVDKAGRVLHAAV
ncbi:hypothetical protein PHSY_002068 [Pseudozyma hubeiensis SY62]|uniref:Uncharacterized protein n=1 Tax=Pseudozyma hubeiensis (strain SY62) TaxID=1305764 RepID=R9P053_PSEHS|nr:hypothetical protein PHSY_002068 [Pseudozyma hubeiensis SY62]GAC94496.1 hypothetical protein PHSY_002068 [Pseudozyma hubeiensis SY62]